MAQTVREQIRRKAVEILKGFPHGLRYSELMAKIQEILPGVPKNTIAGNIWNLEVVLPEQVYKPARGVYLHIQFREASAPQLARVPTVPVETPKEQAFYEPFADWLINELEECTKAIPVGGNRFKDMWGTPDVIGVREPRKSDIVKFGTEIITGEVKIDSGGLITAFGQACAYRLFSHKSYIVVPQDSPEDDIARLDTLARIFGVGLILFNARDPRDPNFAIRVRAAKHDPDMFYVNRYMKLIEDDLFS
jgi:hypothetical protein